MRPFPLLRKFGMLALLVLAFTISSANASRLLAAGTDIVFVARAHLATQDDIFQDEVGPAGQFGSGLPKFAPGSKLMIRKADGSLQTLVDGSSPAAGTGYLIDVQSPDVSFDGSKIVFAGATTIDPDETTGKYGWRLYEIGVNGTGFRKLPIPDRTFTTVPNNNSDDYNWGNYETYHFWNDLFPAYLADGRIVFASSRYPSRSHYDARYDYSLYVVNANGSNLHRITSERGGLLHPTPLPDGRILFSRWWNNFNQPSSKGVFNRIDNRGTDHTLPDGTLIYANPDEEFNPATGKLPDGFEIRDAPNTWHLHVVNTDGTDFHRYAFTPYAEWAREEDSGGDTYTAAQPALVFKDGTMYVAFTSQQDTTMVHSTQKTGIRVARPGVDMLYANIGDSIAGLSYDKAWGNGDDSPPYAIHPAGMPDGKILFSLTSANSSLPTSGHYNDRITGRRFNTQGSTLQYKLTAMNLDGSSKAELAVSIGNADAMDAKPIVARTGWNVQNDQFTTVADDDPTQWNVPSDLFPNEYGFSEKTSGSIQTATIHNPNIYANAPLSLPFINNSPPPGSVTTAEVWIDANQFTGAYCYDYPNKPDPCDNFKEDVQNRAVKYTSVPVSPRGEFTAQIPADVPAFLVLRGADGRVVDGWNRGYISIAQGNAYARPGQTVTCIGCHFGHTSGSIDNVPEATAGWTNVAPYAKASASSEKNSDDEYQPFDPSRVNDRHGFVPVPAAGPTNPNETEDFNKNFQDTENGWMSVGHDTDSSPAGEWVQLKWDNPVLAKSIRLVGPVPLKGDWGGFGEGPEATPYHITSGTLALSLAGQQVGGSPLNVGQVESLADGGTLITLNNPTVIDKLRFTVNSTAGYWYWETVAALNEIQVMGMAGNAAPDGGVPTATPTKSPTPSRTPTVTVTPTSEGTPDPCSGVKPDAPQLVSPAQDAKLTTLAVALDWADSNCVTKYKVVVRLGSQTGTQVVKKRSNISEFVTAPLTKGKAYYWQIKACNGKQCTASAWGKFKLTKKAK